MKAYFVLFFLTIALLFTSNALIAQQLIFQWETDSVFKIPESTLFFSTKNLIYVSNIDGKSSGKTLRALYQHFTQQAKLSNCIGSMD